MAHISRTCGGCVACCVASLIDEPDFHKPPHTMCSHCTGTGCGIHEHKYKVCDEYACEWLMGAAGSDEERPDAVGIIESLYFDLRLGLPLIITETRAGALVEPYARSRIEILMKRESFMLVVDYALKQRFVIPHLESIPFDVARHIESCQIRVVSYDQYRQSLAPARPAE